VAFLRVLNAEKVDKFILVTVECDGYPATSDVRSAAINAALDAGYKFDLGSERMSGRGNVTTLSWQALA
jgi:hypothetical protein